jgi:hypothetical protein
VELEKEHLCTSVVAVLIQGELLDAPVKREGREALHIVVSHGNREERREKEEEDSSSLMLSQRGAEASYLQQHQRFH